MNTKTAPPSLTIHLSATRRGARRARLLAEWQLVDWGFPRTGPTAEAVGVVTAELAANAAIHGRVPGRDFRLRIQLQPQAIRIEVSDARPERGVPTGADPGPAPEEEGGRGLVLVAAFADRWGCVQGDVCVKTVWAEVDTPEPRGARSGTGGRPSH